MSGTTRTMKETSSTGKSHTEIAAALDKIIQRYSNFPAVVREIEGGCCSTGTKKITTNIGSHMVDKKEKESKIICTSEQPVNQILSKDEVCTDNHEKGLSYLTNMVILEQIEVEAEAQGIEVPITARSMVLSLVKNLADLIQEGKEYHSDLEGLISITHFLVTKKILVTTDIGEQLLEETAFLSLPLTSLWRFICIGVVSIEQIIRCIHDGKLTNLKFLDDLTQLVLLKKKDHMASSLVSGILGALIGIAYELPSKKYILLSRFANEILNSLTIRVLDHIFDNKNKSEKDMCREKFEGNEDINRHAKGNEDKSKNRPFDISQKDEMTIMNIYELVLNNLSVTSEAMESYCSAQLVHILTHHPNVQLADVFRDQEKWRFTQADITLSVLMKKLVVALGHETALSTLDLVVTNEEVNWCCVLTFVATSLNCHRAAATTLKTMIEHKIRRGCMDQEMDMLIIGFLFARHASQEGRHIFPSYPQWFSTLFASESGSPASNKQTFTFLVRFLIDLVPHEPAYCLRAHLNSHIFTPKGCQKILQDYFYLVRARLQELRDSLNPSGVDQHPSKTNSKVVEEVEAAINHFSETGKIPSFILEASIFRRPYFCSAFLPSLLMPRPIPDVPDPRSKLIEALHSTGKIPSTIFNKYIEACQKEVSDLLAGVFMSSEDIKEPITELSNMLLELVNQSTCCQDRDGTPSSVVLPVLSQISHKTEEIMKLSDSKLKNIDYLSLDVKKYNEKLVTYQVVEKIIETVESLCITAQPEGNTEKKRPTWLSQFLSLLSSSETLQHAFYTHLVYTLERGQHGDFVQNQMEKYGIILCELWRIEGLFLSVIEASLPNQKPLPFTQFYLNKLELKSKQACIFACSIMNAWLKWFILSESDADAEPSLYSLPDRLLDTYCCLAPRLPLIYCHQSDGELTGADVYLYLDGHDVPEYSRLYFSQILRYGQKHKVSLEKWIIFELQATWEDTPIYVRQTYLKHRVLQDFVTPKTVASDCCQEIVTSRNSNPVTDDRMTLSDLVVQMVFALLKVGLKQQNSNEILMLLQSLAQHIQDSNICLLAKWHKHFTEGAVSDTSILSFMSICQCLPPSFFLRADQLLQLSGVLKSFINQLVVATQDIQPSVCDTVFLFSALLNAATSPGIKNLEVQQCLTPLRTAIVFHWEILSSFFKNHTAIISSHCCLEDLWNTLKTLNKKNITSLTPEESGIRLLALCLQHSVSEEEMRDMVSVIDRPMYLKWLLAYIGLQQMRGSVPFFTGDQELLSDLKEQDRRIILTCQEEVEKLLAKSDALKLTYKIFPNSEESQLGLKSVPTAFALILLLNFFMPYDRQKDEEMNKEIIMAKQFDLLLQCHTFLSNIHDFQEGSEEGSVASKSNNLSRKGYTESDLEYLAKLYQKIVSLLSKISSKALATVSKNTLLRCDHELRAAIMLKLQNSLKKRDL